MSLMSLLSIHTKRTKRALLVVISAPTCGVLSCVHKYTSPVLYFTERVAVSVRMYTAVLANEPEDFTDIITVKQAKLCKSRYLRPRIVNSMAATVVFSLESRCHCEPISSPTWPSRGRGYKVRHCTCKKYASPY